MAEMIERVARKLMEERARIWASVEPADPRFTWETENEAFKDQLRLEARAVIEAMREPTKAMIETANEQFDWGPGYDNAPRGSARSDAVWSVMIDEALKAETTT